MKSIKVGVSSSDMGRAVEFYKILGFEFPELDENHIESKTFNGFILMIDSKSMIKDNIGTEPIPSNHSSFAIELETKDKIDEIVTELKVKGFLVLKEPWDAFWNQRYSIIQDPDGYLIDLFYQY